MGTQDAGLPTLPSSVWISPASFVTVARLVLLSAERVLDAICSSDFFAAASAVSGIAPLPWELQGFACLLSKPCPPGPTKQFSV